jgi:adenosylcobyric acid synthase
MAAAAATGRPAPAGRPISAKTVMIQGTASGVGKSLLVAGLCRLYARRGLSVAPFKAQNLSNNAGVTPDGGEIGRAQVSQAEACGILPHVDMNPVLIKPEAGGRSQVVVLGRAWRSVQAGLYYQHQGELWTQVTASLERLASAYDLIIIEGAGSPAELNLRAGDIVNMAIARYAQCPVLLAGDIDRGGIFAQLLGTLWLLEPQERALVRGLIVNKFRGDPALFGDGMHILAQRGGVPVLGVVPWVANHGVPEEDAAVLDGLPARGAPAAAGMIDIAVVALPCIANFDDFDPLAAEPGIAVRFVRDANALGRPHAVILPGTKHTRADLAWLYEGGLARAILDLAGQGTAVIGICGGYQMLGRSIADPLGIEGDPGTVTGLGLLDAQVAFAASKTTSQVQAQACGDLPWLAEHNTLTGYEIHAGQANAPHPLLVITRPDGSTAPDGASAAGGRIWGTHLHGLFEQGSFRRAWLRSLGWQPAGEAVLVTHRRMAAYNRLADVLETTLDLAQLDRIIWG